MLIILLWSKYINSVSIVFTTDSAEFVLGTTGILAANEQNRWCTEFYFSDLDLSPLHLS